MRIQHNIMAMSAYRNYNTNTSAVAKNLEKLSSGYKINRAGDDAAGLAISEKMRAQITGLNAAQKNVKDGISLVKTAEGAMQEMQDMLNRMDYLATQSANGTYDNEVDRKALQDEVDQLLSEIDRIADSANFNGIKLLDGTLGMNTEAFKVGASSKFVEAVDPAPVDLKAAIGSSYHGGKSSTPVKPSFSIDLNDLDITNTASSSAAIEFTITVGTWSVSATTATLAAGAKATVGALITAIASALASMGTTVGTVTTAQQFGGLYFDVTASSGKISFSYVGAASGTSAGDDTGEDITASLADAFNAAIGEEVTVAAGTGGKLGGQYIHALTAVKNAVGNVEAQRPGADIDLTNLVKDGYKLTIGGTKVGDTAGKTYVFKTDANSTVTAGTGEVLVDVSKYAASEQAHMAALIVAGNAATAGTPAKPDGNANGSAMIGGIFKISAGTGAKIHIDVAAASNASKADTQDKLLGLIHAQDAGVAEKAANTKLLVKDASAIGDGTTLTIDGKKYTFSAKGTGTDDNTTYIKTSDGVDGLKAKLEAAGYTVEKATVTGGTELTISKANNADGTKMDVTKTVAPEILGKGLTLQIGDTSDSYNQLGLTIKDMHAASLGVGGLSIANQEDAAAAIQTIKDAINTVSSVRGTLGATQNRLEHTANNLSVMAENIQDAESTIRDTDIAEEMMSYTKNNILVQSAQAMLAQANQVPQGVLQLLG